MRAHLADFGEFTDETDIEKLLVDEAEGRLNWGNSYKGHVAGSFLVELVRAEPAFLPNALKVLARLIRHSSPQVRELGLDLMNAIPDASNVLALADAMTAAADLYVGVSFSSNPKQTLFGAWLRALGANYPYDWADARRAIIVADAFLELPEAGDQGLELKLCLLHDQR